MAAEPTHRLAQLPGYDTAPDVYETPDVNDDSTTIATSQTSPRGAGFSESATSSEEEDDEEDSFGGVSHRRLYPERSRAQFGRAGVSVKGVDLSDRIDGGRRKGLRVKFGQEGEEGLEVRLARLRREVEECRILAGEQDGEGEEGEGEEEVEALSRLLAGIEVPPRRRKGEKVVFHDALEQDNDTTREDVEEEDIEDEQTLGKISAFDTRLAALETALGISPLGDGSTPAESLPLLPSLALLDSQLATLNTATSLASLEAASARISKLKAEARSLSYQDPDPDSDDPATTLSPTDLQSLQTLYTLLPTLQSLAPTVPALITRLRSLRTLHTTAASASADLDSIEQRQADMDKELKMWREGLEKVEQAVKEADSHNGRNGAMVQEWVKDLEGRMKALGR